MCVSGNIEMRIGNMMHDAGYKVQEIISNFQLTA